MRDRSEHATNANHSPAGLTESGVRRLPVRRSFVVQFLGASPSVRDGFEGRVEHVISGESASFTGADELLAALERILDSEVDER